MAAEGWYNGDGDQRQKAADMNVVRVISTKWDGGPHRDSDAVELGADRHGLWLWMPDDTPVTTPAGTYLARPGLRLIPAGTWWSAYFVPPHSESGRPEQWYVDIGTPAQRRGDLITFIDLDLDVERLGGAEVALLDEDEFALNQAAMEYPTAIIQKARQVAADMVAWIASGTEPFGTVSEDWLNRGRATSR